MFVLFKIRQITQVDRLWKIKRIAEILYGQQQTALIAGYNW